MAIKERTRAAEIICGSRIDQRQFWGLLEADPSAWIACLACAHHPRRGTYRDNPTKVPVQVEREGACAGCTNSTFLIITMMPWYHWPGRLPRTQNVTCYDRLRTAEGENMESAYAVWIGQAVVLQLAAADLRVPLRGIIIGETDEVIQFSRGADLGHRYLQEHDPGGGAGSVGTRFWSINEAPAHAGTGDGVSSANERKVNESRAAALLGLSAQKLRRLSAQSGLGQRDVENGGAQLVFTYAELYRLCRLAAEAAG